MLKFKNRRKSFGGFPARCAGCLLALIILICPFNSFAYSNSTVSDNYDISVLPNFNNLYAQYYIVPESEYKYNVWLFVDPQQNSSNIYYLLFTRNFESLDVGYDYIYDSVADFNLGVTEWIFTSFQQYGTQYGFSPLIYPNYTSVANNCMVYYYEDGITDNWTQYNGSRYLEEYGNYGSIAKVGFATSGMKLLAFTPCNTSYSNNYQVIKYLQLYSFDIVNLVIPDLQCVIDSQGFLYNNDSVPDEPEYSGVLGGLSDLVKSILSFIKSIPTTINQKIQDISTWLTNLGSTIGGFFTDLWINHLSGAFSNVVNWIKAPFQAPDGSLYNLPSKIWNAIKAPFVEGGVVYDHIHGFFDNLKSLFVPTSEQLTELKESNEDLLTNHFGFMYQSYNVIMVFFGQDSETRIRHIYPKMNNHIHNNLNGNATRSINRDVSVTYTLKDLFIYEETDDFDIIIPRLRVKYRDSSNRSHSHLLLDRQIISFNSIMNGLWNWSSQYNTSYEFTFWGFWNVAVNGILIFALISQAYSGLVGVLNLRGGNVADDSSTSDSKGRRKD